MDALFHNAVQGPLAVVAVVQFTISVLSGLIITELWRAVAHRDHGFSWKRVLSIALILFAVSMVGVMILRGQRG